MKTNINYWYLVQFFLKSEMSQTEVVQNIKTHILCSVVFSPENRAVYEIMWKKCCTVGQATDDNKIRRMRFACWIPKATNAHSEYVILVAFSIATVVERTWLNITLHVHYLSCSFVIHIGLYRVYISTKLVLQYAFFARFCNYVLPWLKTS